MNIYETFNNLRYHHEKHIEFTDGKKVPLDAISEIKIE